MALLLLTPAVLAGAFAAAIAFAPTAAADDEDTGSRPDRTGRESSQQREAAQRQAWNDAPRGWSNEAQWARPGPGGSNPFGSLPKPPIFALD